MASFNLDGRMIFSIFIGAIITVVLLASIADQVFISTTILTNTNETVTVPAVNGTLDLTGREQRGNITIQNLTNDAGPNLEGQGLNIITGTGSDGLLSVQLTINDTNASFAGESVNVSYNYNPEGYVSDSGGRNITLLIPILSALAILVTIIVFLWMGSLKELIKKG